MSERQRFEAWAARELMDGDDDEAFAFRRHALPDGRYKDKQLDLAYRAWKACQEVDTARCDELINELDTIARWHDPMDYGLPVGDETVMKQMRDAVDEWASK